jgi:hypothetical protein
MGAKARKAVDFDGRELKPRIVKLYGNSFYEEQDKSRGGGQMMQNMRSVQHRLVTHGKKRVGFAEHDLTTRHPAALRLLRFWLE